MLFFVFVFSFVSGQRGKRKRERGRMKKKRGRLPLRFDFKANDSATFVLGAGVVDDLEVDVVVEVSDVVFDDTKREAELVDRRSHAINVDESLLDSSREIIQDPICASYHKTT